MEFDKMIILASASPQRAELMLHAGLPFTAMAQDADESLQGEPLETEVQRIAEIKAQSCLDSLAGVKPPGRWIAGFDTAVGIGSEIYGKPANRLEAIKAITAIQGTSHFVSSGVAVIDTENGARQTGVVTTRVEFRPMSPEEVNWYVDTGDWRGAAGGYRIQKRASLFIRSLEGSYHNVVGLPLEAFYGMLCALNYPFF